MYLKSLALSGFKTFADDTQLQFGPGITAIVGPNGSGKSNIVDAILWSLGERSHKALRGHAPTDVIFNGSAARTQMGMAEVSLFFDNDDKSLPLDFKEVQVTRRVFRDGDSEYAINKTRCRLRDVSDLFLDTGVGPETYSIVSQREIDSILSAKPEDRRGLIEGVAGVQKYRARRTETRRKLDKVETDLLRVLDITSELESQLLPLAEQAELAREYDNYMQRLRVLQLAILAREYDVRLKRQTALEESQTATAQSVQENGAAIAQLEASEAELELKMRAMEEQMDALQSETTDVVTRLKSEEGAIAVARERRRALTEQQEFQAQEIGLLRGRINAATESMNTQRAELESTQNASAGLSSAAADAEARLGAANAQLSEATRELQQRQSKVIELLRASQSKREAAAAGRAEAQALEHRLQDLQRLAQTLREESQSVAQMRQTVREQLEATRAQHKAAEAKIAQAREKVQQKQNEHSQSANELNAAREQRSGIQSRLNVLRELEENLEGVQGGARSVLSAVKKGQLPDRYTLVADAIRAPRELEQAIEVALGAGVHNLLCDTDAEAKTAITWLKKNQAGRATFLPLNNLRASGVGDRTRALLKERGVRGIASSLVSFDDALRPAVEYLLGRVLIVETLDDAVALARRCDNGVRLVTLEGELVLPAGAITGGQGKQKASGLLARKRELDESQARVEELNRQLQERNDTLNAARAAVEEAQKEQRAAQEEANELRSQIARQEREEEHGEREARRVQNNADATESQLKQVRATVESRSTQQDEFDRQAIELDAQAHALDAAVAEAQKIVAQRQQEREDVATSVADVRAEYSAAQERQSAMRRAIVELERQIKEFEAQIVSKQHSIERAAGEDAQLVAGEAEHVSRLSQLQQRRDELEAAFIQWRAGRQEGLQKLEETGASLRQRRTALHAAEEELHKIEIRLTSTQTEMQDMERRFGEEFSLSVEEALPRRDDIEGKQLALDEIEVLKDKVGALGNVNVGAIQQHEQVKERLDFLSTQKADLDSARTQLEEIIADIDSRTHDRFMTSFKAVQIAFDELFKRVFDGGSTELSLTHPDNLLETGIDLRVQPPGKGAQDISLLSGGERALTALSFMLALLRVNPSPFVVLDEVDAPLDQSNVGRFTQLLREFTDHTQFIVITHNNGTMQAADVLYGVTMQEQGISRLVSVRLVDDERVPHDGSADGANGLANGLSNGAGPSRNGVASTRDESLVAA
ncbi:MAG TPA: chromosome segregation protein SMC [Abditibacteriaceae bacterium]|jgi:chromosome segregation protein